MRLPVSASSGLSARCEPLDGHCRGVAQGNRVRLDVPCAGVAGGLVAAPKDGGTAMEIGYSSTPGEFIDVGSTHACSCGNAWGSEDYWSQCTPLGSGEAVDVVDCSSGLAVDDTNAYGLDSDGCEMTLSSTPCLWRVSLADGEFDILASPIVHGRIVGLVEYGEYLYFAQNAYGGTTSEYYCLARLRDWRQRRGSGTRQRIRRG